MSSLVVLSLLNCWAPNFFLDLLLTLNPPLIWINCLLTKNCRNMRVTATVVQTTPQSLFLCFIGLISLESKSLKSFEIKRRSQAFQGTVLAIVPLRNEPVIWSEAMWKMHECIELKSKRHTGLRSIYFWK